MYTSSTWNGRSAVSAVIAAAIVALSGLVFDHGYVAPPADRVAEDNALAPGDVLPGVTELPAVVVRATRIATMARAVDFQG